MTSSRSIKSYVTWLLMAGVAASAAQAGCGTDNASEFGGGDTSDSGAATPGSTTPGFGDTPGGGDQGDGGPTDVKGSLVITPPTATIAVTIEDGVVKTNTPVPFTASYNGQSVNATWLLDRAELGDLAASGTFTASGNSVGEGVVTARFGAREGTAKVKVTITSTQNGALAGSIDTGGYGGIGGVGGEPLGPAIVGTIATRLKNESNAPATKDELDFLYPYDKTVFPRGLLPPLLMWQSNHEASAIYVKVTENGFTYEGTFDVSTLASGGNERKRVRIDDAPWKTATSGNSGDDLEVEVKIYSAIEDKVIGPITETWKIAPGILKGTVYYNSYDSHVTTGGGAETGGVIAIKPRAPDPVLAVSSNQNKCHVCHELSADGSTLWAQDSNYATSASYDLRSSEQTRIDYGNSGVNDHKFVWSAPYPNGSFALASSRWAREAYLGSDSTLYARSDGHEVGTGGDGIIVSGLSGIVKSTVTPAFAPDGRKIAFNFWEGAGANGVTPGAGRSLAIMDFSCGASLGSTDCGANQNYTFSGIREIYRDDNHWPAWPSFLPDGKAVVFNNEVKGGGCGDSPPKDNTNQNCQLTTWNNATAELWLATDGVVPAAKRLDAANGLGGPTNGSHPDDSQLNYQPTVNPVASGGYYWAVFTSRRIYGNLITGDPWGSADSKKLWVAAIDMDTGAVDPSHPAFYLPGQELAAGNTRGFWVVDPCKSNGNSCETGDECCNGFCRKDPDGGALVCMDKPPGTTCVQEFEKCAVAADCCDATQLCIAGKCAKRSGSVN